MNDKTRVKIAILRRNGYGDLVCAMPVINFLKEKYKQHEFYIFVAERNHALAPYLFPEDNIVVIRNGNKYYQAIKTALKYRSVCFDIGVAPFPDYIKLNNLFLHLLNVKQVFLRKKNDPVGDALANSDLHVGLASIKLVDPEINAIDETWYPRIAPSLVKEVAVDLPDKKILVSVSNNRPGCQLTLNNLCKILNRLYKNNKFSVIISCLHHERTSAQKLQKLLDMPSQEFVTESFDDFLGLLNKADIVFGGDGGACHLAACLDKIIVALYGGTRVQKWGVLSNKVVHFFDKHDVNNIDEEGVVKALADALQN